MHTALSDSAPHLRQIANLECGWMLSQVAHITLTAACKVPILGLLLCDILIILCLPVQGGEFDVSLLLGDPAAAVGLRGDVGTVVLPEAASDAEPKPKLLTAAYQPRNNLKPNIAHTFVSSSWWSRACSNCARTCQACSHNCQTSTAAAKPQEGSLCWLHVDTV